MKRLVVMVGWILLFVTAVFLRFDDLGSRPLHADEATGGRITAQRLEERGWVFDPTHYHGPLLSDVAMWVCRLRGEVTWQGMSKTGLRVVPAVAGSLLVLLPLLWRRRSGDAASLLAAGLLATSPLLVYYSRMFIHEPLLVLFGVAAMGVAWRFPRYGLPGLMIGLMFATKETFAISMLAWAGAAVVVAAEERKSMAWSSPRELLPALWKWVWPSVLAGGVVALGFYTHGFTHWQGAVDAVRTFFVYQVVEGHDKPWSYYPGLLVVPHQAGGVWWYGTPVALLALLAYGRSFAAGCDPQVRRWTRFLFYSVLGHFVIYSLFSYKTPWLVCLPWALVCCLAGMALVDRAAQPRAWRWLVVLLILFSLTSQWRQARVASGRYASDARNPFAYVPTNKGVERMAAWLEELENLDSGAGWHGAAVVGSGYWPLPWYLRQLDSVGYWPDVPGGLQDLSVVIAMPEQSQAVSAVLGQSHQMLPEGLRNEVPIEVYIRNDLWQAWREKKD